MGPGFFPLDEELDLLPGSLTPSLQEEVVHLGAWMPFEKAAEAIARFRRTVVSRSTVERLTEGAGAAYVHYQEEAVKRIEQELPEAPEAPERLFVSADGAMVPLVGGEWAEVKTLVIGEVLPAQEKKGEPVVCTAQHSYFSRLTDAETFQRLSLVETHRRGVERAREVVFVSDGSEWLQGWVDYHRPNAVRVLDFYHAAQHIAAVGQGCWGEGSNEGQAWLAQQLDTLKRKGPTAVLKEVARLVASRPDAPELATHLAYLEKRTAHMDYPAFVAAGWPIGSGATESGNKLVVQERLKGSGMHWARHHVDPMLALRNIVCSDRWEEAWPQIVQTRRQQEQQRRRQRRLQRQRTASPASTQPHPAPSPPAVSPAGAAPPPTPQPPLAEPPASPKQPWRPPPDHPWRRMPIGKARFQPTSPKSH